MCVAGEYQRLSWFWAEILLLILPEMGDLTFGITRAVCLLGGGPRWRDLQHDYKKDQLAVSQLFLFLEKNVT